MGVDLVELATRESEQVEWKAGVADPDDVVRTLVAFSNDLTNLGGGYVVCGAQETKDVHGFQRLEAIGLESARLREVEGRVLAACRDRVSPPIVPLTEELRTEDPERRILVFIIAATSSAHALRSSDQGSRYYVRIGRETREARNGLLLELITRKGARPAWDRLPVPWATASDIDLLALRDTLARMGAWDATRPIELLLSAERAISVLVPPLCIQEQLTGVLRPRSFSLLLFGREPQRLLPEAHVVFSVYPGVDRAESVSRRVELTGTLVQQATEAMRLLRTEAWRVTDWSDPAHPNRWRYPERALDEAVVNAIVHRSYELHHPVRITVFSDRVEIHSPGGLDRSVTPDELTRGVAAPAWRNQSLAWFFSRLGLAQGEGQGIAAILRTMEINGNPPPEFHLTPESVRCVLRARG